MEKIKYIGFYDCVENKSENRNYVLSAVNKMNYIIDTVSRNNVEVEIISPSWTYNNKYYRSKTKYINHNIKLILSPTLPWGGFLRKIFSIIFTNLWIIMYFIKNVNKEEKVIVYHSPWLIYALYIIKRIKKIKIILEVEEIYSDVRKTNCLSKYIEYKVIRSADGYIFSTELLNNKINRNNKPYEVIYGTYKAEKERKIKFNDNKIHVVYAGTFDARKGGANIAVDITQYLPESYHIHIIGFGSKKDTESLLSRIDKISKISCASITYDGLLNGDEYTEFLQKCHIGLSTQTAEGKYNETSFPSKVLSYMANGLRVVSARIKVVQISRVGNEIFYYDEQDPKEIADIIKSIDINKPYDSRGLMRTLDKEFTNNIKNLLEK